MKKQIILTAALLLCTLVVLCSYIASESDRAVTDSVSLPSVTHIRHSADIPPVSEASTSLVRPAVRLYLFRGLPFNLNGIRLISIVQIMLMALLIGLFIKPCNPKIEYIFDSDGKK